MTQGKIVVLGAGHVGSHVASALAVNGIGTEIVLVDLEKDKAKAQALDIADSLSMLGHASVVRAGEHGECADADLVIVAIGEPRQPGQTRLDLLDRSVVQMDLLVSQLKPYDINCPIVTITNPADIVAYYLRKALEKERWRCFSTGTLLDTARLRRILSEKTGVARTSIQAFAMGEHGDSSMAAFSHVSVGGLPFDHFGLDREELLHLTRDAGMQIVIGKGSTEFGIGMAMCMLAKCILRDEKQILPVSVTLEGEYGQTGVNCGVPCSIGKNGIEEIIEFPLAEDEQALFNHSCDIIRSHIARAEKVHNDNN